jgi:hypothetical protein
VLDELPRLLVGARVERRVERAASAIVFASSRCRLSICATPVSTGAIEIERRHDRASSSHARPPCEQDRRSGAPRRQRLMISSAATLAEAVPAYVKAISS